MAIRTFWTIGFRDLLRNRRRSIATIIAVALGLMVIMLMAGMLKGMVDSGLRDNIRINTGHLQLREESYEIEKMSLLARDLLVEPQAMAAQIETLPETVSAAPVLWASTVLSTARESAGLQIWGVNPASPFHEPLRQGLVEGSYLTADSRGEILLGKRLADDMDISVGQRVSLATGDSNGSIGDALFTVAGIFNTGFPSYDQSSVIMPIAQAQSLTRTGDRASTIIITLHNRDDTAVVASKLAAPEYTILTWEDLNQLMLTLMETGGAFYYIIYVIVILVVAVVIANTLLMSVFERTRELGILASLGMKQRQIMLMVLLEAVILSLIGIAIGLVLGLGSIAYLSRVGFNLGEDTAGLMENMAMGSKMYPAMAPDQFFILSLLMLAIVTLVSVYPAWVAARMEPVEALHAF